MKSEFRNVVLSIDTSRYDALVVGLDIDGEKKIIEEAFDYRKSQGVLPLIEKSLQDNGLTLQHLTGIKVNTGPGSFTGLRVGVAVANTLGTMLQIPINGLPPGELAEPIYE